MRNQLNISLSALALFNWLVPATGEGFEATSMNVDQTSIITATEADQRIFTTETAKHEANAELKRSLQQVPSFYETEESLADRKVILRRIPAPAELPLPKPALNKTATESVDFSRFPQPTEEHVNLQLYATVYDGAYSKLILTLEKTRYTVWTNLNFIYLPFLAQFTIENRNYFHFGLTHQVTQEREALNTRFAEERGFDYQSRWQAPPVAFGETPEYVLVTEDARDVPEEVYRQLDDLTAYYLANEKRLKTEFHNTRELQAARERYKNAHPEEPQDIVLNYSRMSAPAE